MTTATTVLGLLTALALVSALSKRVPLPLPLLLIATGIGLSFVPPLGRIEIEPDIFFLVFIPPLLFADGWQIPKRELLRVLRPVMLLAFGLVLMTVVGVGLVLHWLIPSLPLAVTFALGAIVSPTDAVATHAMAGKAGLPARATHILDGESLINDASGLVAFRFAAAAAATGTFSLVGAAGALLFVSVGGAVVGYVVAWLVGRIRVALRERCADDPSVQTVLSVLTPFAAYLAAEHAGVSGILAVVVAGLYAGWNDFKTLDARTRNHAWEVWDMLLFAFNGLVFLLLGISLAHALAAFEPDNVARYLAYAFSLWAALTLLRLVWVYPAAYLPQWLSRRVREREGRRDAREVFLVGWAGLRGSVTMAAALSIPATLANGQPFPGRDLVIFLAATTIVLTLVLNGLSLPLLARALAAPLGTERERERRAAEIAIAQAGSAALERAMQTLATPGEQAQARELLASYRRRAERHASMAAQSNPVVDGEPLERRLSLLALEAERDALYALRDAGTINDQTLREIEARLDAADLFLAAALRTAG